ncbi:MAG: hypothetical protein ACOX7R_01180 [Acetivibrionales bacterium]
MLQIPTLIVYKDGRTISYEGLRDDWADSFIDSTKDFISSIKNNREPKLTGEEGREVLRFALAALQSAKLNRQVSFG